LDTTQVDSQPPEPLVHRNPTRTILWEFLQTVALTLLVFLVVNLTTARVRVSGPSMRPTLEGGEYIIVSKLSYRLGRPQRGDIVVFHSPDPSTSEDLIKRIVGLPGDTVEFVDGRVWLNGAALDEPYAVGLTGSDQTWKIGPDQLFVLGDNRAFSRDSHNFGPVPVRDLVGKAWLIYWPPSEWGAAEHRAGQEATAGRASRQWPGSGILVLGRGWQPGSQIARPDG
jgi:signal peptidase I